MTRTVEHSLCGITDVALLALGLAFRTWHEEDPEGSLGHLAGGLAQVLGSEADLRLQGRGESVAGLVWDLTDIPEVDLSAGIRRVSRLAIEVYGATADAAALEWLKLLAYGLASERLRRLGAVENAKRQLFGNEGSNLA